MTVEDYIDLLLCPKCGEELALSGDRMGCGACAQEFEITGGIPMLFWPTQGGGETEEVTEIVKSFYEETPFPDYDEFDSPSSLAAKARKGIFARMLDDQIPPGARVLECGCGTGQLSCFLSMANRGVFATDMCMNSLRLGHSFSQRHGLKRVGFLQMNLFRPVFRPASFDVVISNGVLLTTADPFLGFKTIARLVKPGGHLIVGLYHSYGRWITNVRRVIFRLFGDRFLWLDPNLREMTPAKRRAWLADQYKHPHETTHTIGETIHWFESVGFTFVRSLPSSRPFQPFSESGSLFEPEAPGNALERLLAGLKMIAKGSREGGFFIVIGTRATD